MYNKIKDECIFLTITVQQYVITDFVNIVLNFNIKTTNNTNHM